MTLIPGLKGQRSVLFSFSGLVGSFVRACVRAGVRLFVSRHLYVFVEDKFRLLSLQGAPHKLAVIFVDNSGVDIILGMFPFVRELLSRGTKVNVLC